MDKNIGFNRNIFLAWLDAAGSFAAESQDPHEIRRRLEPVVGQTIASSENRRKAIDILIRIWVKTAQEVPELQVEAVQRFQNAMSMSDRLWLHYGLTIVAYPFFRQVAATIGQLGRNQDWITPSVVKQRLAAERGPLGSMHKAVERVVFSLRDWGLLSNCGKVDEYRIGPKAPAAGSKELEKWLLACALHAHPGDEVPFIDLVRLPELFPFRFSVGMDDLRGNGRFAVQRHGEAWDGVRLLAR
jgi:hypothetical protein